MTLTNPLSNFLNSASIIQRNLYNNQLNINTSLERLSTGLRLNSAADDPIDFTLANKFKTHLMGTEQAIGNTQLSINLVGTATNGAQSVLSNLQRIRELTLQSLSDTNTDSDRNNIQSEIDNAIKDIDRIVSSNNFNSRQLLDGSSSGFRGFEQASSSILDNFTFTTTTTGTNFDFLTGNIQVDPRIDINDTIQFQTQLDTATSVYSLEVRSANSGTLAYYNDIASSPYTFNFTLPTSNGPGNISIDRSPYDFERITGPLTATELNKPLQQLVNNDRLSPINYGTLNLNLGPNTYNVSVSSTSTVQSFLNSLNALSSGPNVITASYDFGTGKITLDYTGQAQNTSTTVTSYTVPDPAAAGGPFADFSSLPAAVQGPAYRDITLPATGFAIGSPPGNFPSLPAALDTGISYVGTDASISNVFGLSDAANAGTVSTYTSEFYGETVATATPGEYVNRTRAVITDVTATQDNAGSDTGLTAADANTSFETLNTAKVSSASLAIEDFSIDFGANGIYTFNGFDPNTHTIDNIIDDINDFATTNGVNVSASYNDVNDSLSLSNTVPVATPKLTDTGLSNAIVSVDFGANGTFNYAFDPDTDTIQKVVDALNTFAGGNVSATYNEANDELSITNTPTSTKVSTSTPFVNGDNITVQFDDTGTIIYDSGPLNFDSLSIQNVVDGINTFASNNSLAITAAYNAGSDQLSITNDIGGNSRIIFGGTAAPAFKDFFKIQDVATPGASITSTSTSAIDNDGGGTYAALDIDAGDVSSASLNSLTTTSIAAGDSTIDFKLSANAQALRDIFKLSDIVDTGAATTAQSSGDIDNQSTDPSLDITATDVTTSNFTNLTSPIDFDNQITFGGLNGSAIASFFQLSDVTISTGGGAQSISSSVAIDNGTIDPSLELTASDRSNTALQDLRSPKLDTLVSGTLRLNGEDILTIDANTDTITDVVDAINTFSPSGNLSYSANFDASTSGGISITISDTENLAAAGSQPASDPSGASPTIIGNQLSLDSAAYFATGAPVFEQAAYAATPLTPNAQGTPYATTNPTEPNVSAISFGGSTNIASVLFLNNAASGASTVIGDEFQGTATATSHNTYDLTGNQRRTFEASSSSISSQRLGFDTSAIEEADIPADGIIGEVRIVPQTRFRSEENALQVQVGAQAGNQIRLDIADLSTRDLRLENLKVYENGDDNTQLQLRGENALNTVDQAIESSLTALSELGASQNVLGFQLNGLEQERETVSQSLSDTQDADITQEITNLTRAQINIQVGIAILAENRADTRDLYDVLFGKDLGITNFFNKS